MGTPRRPRVTDDLREICRCDPRTLPELTCIELVEAFGDWAAWALADALLERAAPTLGSMPRPRLADVCRPGACLPLFVTDGSLPLLRRSFGLPLVWTRAAAGRAVVPLGQRVAEDLRVTGWVLTPLGKVDQAVVDLLSQPEVASWESAWLPAAIGLLSAQDQWQPKPDVVATGAWSRESGITAVGYVKEKVQLALELGARQLILPELNRPEARAALEGLGNGTLELITLPTGHRPFQRVVRAVLTDLLIKPPSDAPDEEHKHYVEQLLEFGQADRASDYYETVVAPKVAHRLRQQWLEMTRLVEVPCLVSIASNSPITTCYSAACCRPKRLTLLHTSDMRRQVDRIRRLLRRLLREDSLPDFDPLEFRTADELLSHLRTMRHQADLPSPLVLDLTPGTKEMTLELAQSVARPGDFLFYLRHRQGHRAGTLYVVPYTEEVRVWRAGNVAWGEGTGCSE